MKKWTLFFGLLTASFSVLAQPANDECTAPESILVETANTNTYSALLSTATESLVSSCDNGTSTNYDVWFEFTMPVDGNVRITGVTSGEGFALYDSCGGSELACFNGTDFFYALAASTTYLLRVNRTDQTDKNFTIQAFSEASNDECATKQTITVVTGSTSEYSIDYRTATESPDPGCANPSFTNLDLWYEFTMPVNGNVRITNITAGDVPSLFDVCSGTELFCFSGSGFFYNLTAGTDYVLRMAKGSGSAGIVNMRLQAFPTEANDECVNRQSITVDTSGTNTYAYDLGGATESTDSSCDNASNTNLDVWYEFTMPVDGNVRITSIGGSDSATLYDGCGGVELSCFYSNGFFYDLSMGTTYVLRMSKRSVFASTVDFDIQAFATASNDDCADRETIIVQTGGALTYNYDNRAATESLDGSCDTVSQTNLDVWFEFTMPVNGNVRITSLGGSDGATIFDSCGGAELDCFYGNGFFYNLTMGTTYVLRMNKRSVFAGAVDFNIEAFGTIANDDCANREIITVQTGSALTYSYDNRAATESTDGSCDTAGNDNLDVWYEFTMPVDGNVRITSVGGSDGVTLYDACGGAELDCFYGNTFFYSLTMGTTYVLRMSRRAVFAGFVDFDIEAFPGVDNDGCSDAETIAVGVVAPTSFSVDNRGATEVFEASCDNASQINMDLWFSFEMPVTGNLEITGTSGSNGFSIFDSCGGAELYCAFGNGTAFGLEGGTTYWLRVNRRAVFATVINFDLQALESPLSPCAATTEWISGAWNNGLPDLTTNAIIRSNYDTAVSGDFACCSLSVDTGTTLFIRGGNHIDVAFNVDVNGTLDINHEGSLVQRDGASLAVNNGIIRVRKTTPLLKPKDFMIMSSPLDAETRNGVFASSIYVLDHETANFVPNPDVTAQFPLAENFADDNGDFWNFHTGLIEPGVGYLVRPQNGGATMDATYDLVFDEGTLNNGDINFPVIFNTTKNDSPNVLGNPYASAIFADDFINANSMVDEVYFWEHLTPPSPTLPGAYNMNFSMEDISMYNLTGGIAAASDPTGTDTEPNGFISSAQGFGIKATASGTATFTNSMRRLTKNDNWRTSEEVRERIWLEVRNEEFELQSTALIGFFENTTLGLDVGFDSKRLATIVSLYSETESGAQLGIQAREAFNEEIKIPLGFSTLVEKDTEFSISIKQLEGTQLGEANIYLFDALTGQSKNLKEGDYTFSAFKGDYQGRFTLYFDLENLGLNEQGIDTIVLYPNPSKEVVILRNIQKLALEQATVYDLSGRVIKTFNLTEMQTTKTLDISDLSAATYMMVVSGVDGRISKPFIKE
ncbi:MAG: T9SS type A sorting domain-containing protein [Bacteroidota bacterium]